MNKNPCIAFIDIETSDLFGKHDIVIVADDPNMWWTTKKGENIRIDKMETGHLKNTISMLKRARGTPRRLSIIRNMQEEYFKRLGPAGEVLFGKSK